MCLHITDLIQCSPQVWIVSISIGMSPQVFLFGDTIQGHGQHSIFTDFVGLWHKPILKSFETNATHRKSLLESFFSKEFVHHFDDTCTLQPEFKIINWYFRSSTQTCQVKYYIWHCNSFTLEYEIPSKISLISSGWLTGTNIGWEDGKASDSNT